MHRLTHVYIDINPDKLLYYPLKITLDRCNKSFSIFSMNSLIDYVFNIKKGRCVQF